jgi:MFS family permease
MWIPIIALGYLFLNKNLNPGSNSTLLIIFFTILTLFGAFASPAWNSLIKDNVDRGRGEYFGRRNRIITIVAIAVMLIGGLILNSFSKINILRGFIILFGVAFIARLISAYFIAKHYEPKLELDKKSYFSLFDFIKGIPKSNFGKFTLFIGLISLAASIASPFFTVYLLKDLNLNYIVWTIVIVSNSISTFISMPLWGKFSDDYGNLRVLKWTGAVVGLIPLLWFLIMFLIKINIPLVIGYLIVVELFSGFIWAGFNLSAVNFIYDAVSREKLALCVSYYNIINGVGVFIGASLGGLVASMNFSFLGVSPILFLFVLSAIARFGVYLFMIPKIKEVREIKRYNHGVFKKRLKKVLTPTPFKFLRHTSSDHNEFILG